MLFIGVLEKSGCRIGCLLARRLAKWAGFGGALFCDGKTAFHFGEKKMGAFVFSSSLPPGFSGMLWDMLVLSEPLPESGENTALPLRTRIAVTGDTFFPSLLQADEIISCGPSSRDTLTFSSLTDEKGVLSIQRTIVPLNGAALEPGETEVYFDSYPIRHLLVASGALLGAGMTPGTLSSEKFGKDL